MFDSVTGFTCRQPWRAACFSGRAYSELGSGDLDGAERIPPGPGVGQRPTMSFCPGRILLSSGRILLSLRSSATEIPFWTATR